MFVGASRRSRSGWSAPPCWGADAGITSGLDLATVMAPLENTVRSAAWWRSCSASGRSRSTVGVLPLDAPATDPVLGEVAANFTAGAQLRILMRGAVLVAAAVLVRGHG